MQELSLREIQLEEMNVLDRIVEICKKLNLSYQLAWGTLIGAVRHKGFIPWDDDLDIIMLREDYEKFISYCEDHKDELKPYCLFNIRNNLEYVYGISRFCNTSYKIDYQNVRDYGLGIFVDIYPLDNMGNSEQDIKTMQRKANRYIKLAKLLESPHFRKSDRGLLHTLIRASAYVVAKCVGRKSLLSKLDEYCYHCYDEESQYAGIPVVVTQRKAAFAKKYFTETVSVDFEDRQYCIPKCYDQILTQFYGDYMTPPPVEQRIGHHYYTAYKK